MPKLCTFQSTISGERSLKNTLGDAIGSGFKQRFEFGLLIEIPKCRLNLFPCLLVIFIRDGLSVFEFSERCKSLTGLLDRHAGFTNSVFAPKPELFVKRLFR